MHSAAAGDHSRPRRSTSSSTRASSSMALRAEILRPMAAVILAGLVTASAFSVLVLPALVHRLWRPQAHPADASPTYSGR